MKVKELKEWLNKMNENLEVLFWIPSTDDKEGYWDTVEVSNIKVEGTMEDTND